MTILRKTKQSEYNLFKREAEKDLLPYTAENGISFIPYFPLASGLLAGKYTKDTKFEGGRAKNPLYQGETYLRNLEKVEKLRPIAKEKGVDVAHVVLAWYLSQPSIDAVIPGAKRPEQVIDNLKTLEVSLTEADVQKISTIFQ